METPTSTRRITRSQTKAAAATATAAAAAVISDHDHPIKNLSTSKYSRKDRSALFDISNDSPVLGLAMGSMKKSGRNHRRFREIRTPGPGSGEALLRHQVKILLKKVEKDQLGHFLGFNGGGGGGGLFGPTPANTPQAFFNPCQDGSLKETPVHQRSIRKNLFL